MRRKYESGKPEGKYSNFFKIGHNSDVFVIDHFQIFPEDHDAEPDIDAMADPKARIITSPSDAKQLLGQLKSSIEAYEHDHGPISGTKGP